MSSQTLLYLEASPRKPRSVSTQVAEAYLDAFRESYPEVLVQRIDLWHEPLPSFDLAAIEAKYAVLGNARFDPAQEAAWGRVRAVADRFRTADYLLISSPMWNFSVPYVLKHYIDLVNQPGLTFNLGASGYEGLMPNTRATLIISSAGGYSDEPGVGPGSSNHCHAFLKTWLASVGIARPRLLAVAPTWAAPDELPGLLAGWKKTARHLAETAATAA